ncbi:MAG: hypothetical protein KF700_11220 [Hyphomonadaceae bacterium]|nr:hypothetical protein [Hyphomonadaceae bacterium]
MERGGILRRIRTAGLLLALFALTFKAMLPPGFMLDTSGDRLAITLCGGADVYIDASSGALSHKGGDAPADQGSQHCPFAFASAHLLEPPTVGIQAPGVAPSIQAAGVLVAAVVDRAAGPPLPARGPPLQA